MTFVARSPGRAASVAENRNRSSSCSGTSAFRPRSVAWDAQQRLRNAVNDSITWEDGYSDYTDGDDETVDPDEDDDDANGAPEEEVPGGDIEPGGPPAELELPVWPPEQV
jgi:hypothetical protein